MNAPAQDEPPAPAPDNQDQPKAGPGSSESTASFDWNHPATWPMLRTVAWVVAGGGLVVGGGYALITWFSQSLTVVQRVTTAFAIATAIGALVALVVNLRKQDISETTERRLTAGESREIAAAFTDRFRNAAEQLGRPAAPERIAGVYAMAALADEYPDRAQQCVDVLCGYLRLPYDPRRDGLVALTTTYTSTDRSTVETAATPAFDGIVRTTITDAIRARTIPSNGSDRGVWSNLAFNLTRAHLVEANLDGAQFHGTARFYGAQFHGDAWLHGAQFHGDAGFDKAQFHNGAGFYQAQFHNGAGFAGAQFHGLAGFAGVQFHGTARFYEAHVIGIVWFDGAQFHGDAWFDGVQFHGFAGFAGVQFHGLAGFAGVQFHGLAGFAGAQFHNGAGFYQAQFHNGAGFYQAQFHADVTFDKAQFHADVTFDKAQFRDTAQFREAQVAGQMSFDQCPRIPGSIIDISNLRLVSDKAVVTKDGEDFTGWDLRPQPKPDEPEADPADHT